jgi:hypothetical protein
MTSNDEQANAKSIPRKENRQRLARATTQHFEALSPSELTEDQSLVESLSEASVS